MGKVKSFKIYIVIAVLLVIFIPPFAKYQELRYKNKKLEETINNLREENKKLASEKRSLETDIVYIEKAARNKIGVVRKGEIVLKE